MLKKYGTSLMFSLVLVITVVVSGILVSSSLGFKPLEQKTNLQDVRFSSVQFIKDQYTKLTGMDDNASVIIEKLNEPIDVATLSKQQLVQVKKLIAANKLANQRKIDKAASKTKSKSNKSGSGTKKPVKKNLKGDK